MNWVRLIAAMSLLLASPAFAGEVGFSLVDVPDMSGHPMQVGIWYPTRAAPSEQRLELSVQQVAPDAPVAGGGHGLVVISHGNGGSLANHYDTALALAQAGFVVAAMTHPGDNYRDQSRATELADRPRAVHAVLGYMLADWPGHATIDPAKIGMFGFSAGGLTALVAIGGVPDLSTVGPYCRSHTQVYACAVIKAHPVSVPIMRADWLADPRIKAAVIAAPRARLCVRRLRVERGTGSGPALARGR